MTDEERRALAEASRLLAARDRLSAQCDAFDRFLAGSADELRGSG